jgi:hypothetical protein
MGLKLLDSRVLVRPATYAAAVGLRPEDRILAVGGRAVADGTLAAVCHGAPGRQQEFLTLASASMSVVASRDGKIRTAFVGRFGGERIVTWEPGAATRLPRTLRFGAEKARAKAESALYLVPTAGIAVVPDGMDVRLSVNGYTFVESTGSGVLKPGAVRLDHSTGETRVVEPGESVRFSVDRPGQWGVFVPKGTAVPRLEPDGNGGGGFVLQVGQAVKR